MRTSAQEFRGKTPDPVVDAMGLHFAPVSFIHSHPALHVLHKFCVLPAPVCFWIVALPLLVHSFIDSFVYSINKHNSTYIARLLRK